MKKKKPFKTKKRKDVGCPNSHIRLHLCLTPKQVAMLLSSLASTAGLRATEKEREYARKVYSAISSQVGRK